MARGDRNSPGDQLDGGGIAIGLPNKPATKVIDGVDIYRSRPKSHKMTASKSIFQRLQAKYKCYK